LPIQISHLFIFTQNSDMKIMAAGPADKPEIARLVNSAYRGTGAKTGWTHEAHLLDGNRTDEEGIAELQKEADGVVLKCVNDEGSIAGCVYLQKQGDRLYLGLLSVSPDLQAKGIGKSLLRACDDYAKRTGCQSVFMTVISLRTELIEWYERHGYLRTGETRAFHHGVKFGIKKQALELVVLEKRLDG
jgi:ribosomal protein S18 acetylase RimI-like enzyme